MKEVLELGEGQEEEMWKIDGGGFLFSVLKRMFKLIDWYEAAKHFGCDSTFAFFFFL